MSRALIVGSVALDTIETPHGKAERAIGGSGSYGCVAASYFTDVSMVGVVGEDFPAEALEKFKNRGIDVSGLQVVEGGKTFHWSGYYERDMGVAHTNTTELNVFESFRPQLSESHRDIPYVFLANIHPALQLDVLDQIRNPKLVVMDTMNFWIGGEKAALTEVIKRSDILLMNDQEVRQYTEKMNLIEGGRELLKLGPRTVVIKKGEHGALVFMEDKMIFFPAFPVDKLKDPTGAGDTFAGGLIGYMARLDDVTGANLTRGVHIGSTMASFVVEGFSFSRMLDIGPGEVKRRADLLHDMCRFPMLEQESLEDIRATVAG